MELTTDQFQKLLEEIYFKAQESESLKTKELIFEIKVKLRAVSALGQRCSD